ncbi:cyanophycinase [Polyangium aurulentum]|uniref:cyanophycinase n=1 Tax=Polyangium aurulentum TaxID=2567896 RepID=UPI0010AE9B5B|nr:cyanophycinase [Polyangium aurulentum]UQA63936.1 cyanophycinase [Polyangium aurulentum]
MPVEGADASTHPDAGARRGGALVIVGGHEDRTGDKRVLREILRRAGGRRVVVATVASGVKDELWAEYDEAFRDLGAADVAHLSIESRDEAMRGPCVEMITGAGCVFFTGGDQLLITSKLGGTPVARAIAEMHGEGGVIAGTSAGASVMSETMLISGRGEESPKVGNAVRMAPGLGFVRGVVVDQHFAERGRIGRLLAAVAHNPQNIGVGIDEDTAVIFEEEQRFSVFGSGAVTIVDARAMTYTNLCSVGSDCDDRAMSFFDVRLHVLGEGDVLDLVSGRPSARGAGSEEERSG